MRKKPLFGFLLLLLLFMTACGITEELEQAKTNVADLKSALTEQSDNYQQLSAYIEEIPEAFQTDRETDPAMELFIDETGEVFDNLQLRQELHSVMTKNQKNIKTIKKELDRIVKKNGADVNNGQLTLISRSLEIVTSNFDSLNVYVETSIAQEKQFYDDLPMEDDNLDEELSIIQRTYGAMDIVSEEAQANIDYSLSLIKTFEKEAAQSKERGK
ncbi:hypothetical protein I6N95_11165 [Vagococcus sp. BWB3-3]|uniref:EMYY motif lipoprotein n=1 Tax=Vagococcus allomyrinae TaxID=2794353 RepID=A0A940P8D6_9ENTE|nr:hypothetical protein [Vagococcus allomyrinae]MBP1041566.1 hypothetical protein [Vagococcus allomyrinae]